jgi:hypothetical protein
MPMTDSQSREDVGYTKINVYTAFVDETAVLLHIT